MPRPTTGIIFSFVVLTILSCSAQRDDRQVRPPVDGEDERTCQPIRLDLCRGLGYLNATLPNPRGHTTQDDVNSELEDYRTLISTGCSGALVYFLCSFYLPFCAYFRGQLMTLKPCRNLCEFTRTRCEPEYDNFTLDWPVFLNCSSDNFADSDCFGPSNPALLSVLPSFPIAPTPTQSLIPPTIFAVASTPPPTPSPGTPTQCERIQISFCLNVGYNWTSFPNAGRQVSQQGALMQLENFVPLIRQRCSEAIVHYLCAHYVPECRPQGVLRPCRDLCEFVRDGCMSNFSSAGIAWPEEFNCGILPVRPQSLCSGPVDVSTVSIPLIPGITSTEPATSASPTGSASTNLPSTLTMIGSVLIALSPATKVL